MSGFFNPDNWLWKFFGKIYDFFGLSCMWVLCSMPLVTVGPASIALYDTAAHCLRGDETKLAKRFFRTFKKELVPGILLTLVWAAIAMAFWFGYQIVFQMAQADPAVAIFAVVYYVSLLIPVGALCWIFAVESRFFYKFFQLHKMALYFTFAHLPSTVALVILALIAIEVCVDFPFMVIFVPGILVYFQSFFIEKVFKRYMPETGGSSMRRSICLILLIALLTAGCLGCVPRQLENNAETWMQQVLEAIAAEDCEMLVSLFGTDLADETDAQALFDFIQGQIQAMELTEGPSYLSTHGGLYRQWDMGCDLTTSAGAYRIAIRVTGMETDMTLQSLYIIRAEDIDPETGYWGGIVFTPGITIAGIQ